MVASSIFFGFFELLFFFLHLFVGVVRRCSSFCLFIILFFPITAASARFRGGGKTTVTSSRTVKLCEAPSSVMTLPPKISPLPLVDIDAVTGAK